MESSEYRNLGSKTFWYMAVSRSKLAFAVLAVAISLSFVRYFADISESTDTGNVLDFAVLSLYAAFIAILLVVVLFAWIDYSNFKFTLSPDSFKIMRGFFTKTQVAIPYRRVESVDVSQHLVHQLFGVSHIAIETTMDEESAANSKNDVHDEVFPVIDKALALEIQEELTKRANVQKMRM